MDDTISPTVVLLPSPLLGPAVWEPVAAALRGRGHRTTVVASPSTPPRAPSDVRDHILSSVPEGEPVVLVPHSNAGLFVPAVVRQRDVVGVVFVDAGLPPSSGRVPLSPPAHLGHLAELADADGLLPPWTKWWDPAEIAALFPDAQTQHAVEAEEQRLPLGYFRGELEVPTGWDQGFAGAYLAFGSTYAAEAASARRRGWPVRTFEGAGHLHQLVDPGGVADAIGSVLAG